MQGAHSEGEARFVALDVLAEDEVKFYLPYGCPWRGDGAERGRA